MIGQKKVKQYLLGAVVFLTVAYVSYGAFRPSQPDLYVQIPSGMAFKLHEQTIEINPSGDFRLVIMMEWPETLNVSVMENSARLVCNSFSQSENFLNRAVYNAASESKIYEVSEVKVVFTTGIDTWITSPDEFPFLFTVTPSLCEKLAEGLDV